jgi:hypothetical protein
MGKMIIDISSEIRISPELREQLLDADSISEFIQGVERNINLNLKDFGEISDLTTNLDIWKVLKTSCKITATPELIKQFEKWDHLEMIRMIEGDLRLTLNTYGEILDFRNHYDYEPDIKTFKNPLRSFLFFN